ncbi:Uncharacterized protein dnm_014680 [Desulfonema magnum]|uniref:Uncharacterized protein n=1 Tax=Desulfonema magnum TaxID=45655 RepID=A0A975BHE4_9BACT|nr:Uncharacterized protein dnm_014680 [Desulfonema magnum]
MEIKNIGQNRTSGVPNLQFGNISGFPGDRCFAKLKVWHSGLSGRLFPIMSNIINIKRIYNSEIRWDATNFLFKEIRQIQIFRKHNLRMSK